MNISDLMIQFAKANIQLDGIYRVSVPPGSKVAQQTTMEGVCGLVFPIGGKARFDICKKEYLLEPGTVLHAGSKMELYKEVLGDEIWEYILVHYRVLNEENWKESLLDLNFTLKIYSDRNREIVLLLEKLIQINKKSGYRNELISKALLYEIISNILDFSAERMEYQQKDPFDRVIDYIHTNLDKNLVITELAEAFGMNPKQFSYLFQKKIGLSPKKYIMDIQIKRAKELIIEEDISISEIAALVGYEDSLHFSRIFKQNLGMSPSKFRNQFGKNPY
jgi:AraC-like DNA-binding protein